MHKERRIGMYGKKQSERQKKIVSEANKGKVVSEEIRKKLSLANKGRKKPADEVARSAATYKERYKLGLIKHWNSKNKGVILK